MPGGYESHVPILAAMVSISRGPILELGCGDGSTPLIHYASRHHIVSADTDEEWLKRFAGYRNKRHDFYVIKPVGDDATPLVTRLERAWSEWKIPESRRWGLAFLDCAPGEARHEIAARLADRADFIVCHDSETDYASGGNYQYDKIKPLFKYVSEFRRFRPYTLILSNVEEFPIEECDREWSPPKS